MRWLSVCIVLSLVLVGIWFSTGKMLARAEEGVPFYNAARTFRNVSHLWQDSQFGSYEPFLFPRAPLYGVAAWFQPHGITGVAFQKTLFFFLILTPLVTMPLLSRSLFGNVGLTLGRYAALFYVFNLFVLSQVLQRFIYPLMFLWSYLPLFLYLWSNWLKGGKWLNLLLLVLSTMMFSDAFGLASSVVALWVPAAILTVASKSYLRSVVGLVIWIISNIWWWYPLVAIKDNVYLTSLNIGQQVQSLIDVSKYYSSSEIMFLKQAYYLGPQSFWGERYALPYNVLISTGLLVLTMCGVGRSLLTRRHFWLVGWLVGGWFLVKGANPPGGIQFYSWIFEKLPFLTLLRNPYEKLGVIFLLPYCLLATWGLTRLSSRWARFAAVLAVVFLLMRPLWSGQVFASYVAEVPVSYREVNNYLNSQGNVRLLQLPFLHEAGMRYKWGYQGDDAADLLFDRPSLSKTFDAPGDPYKEMYKYLQSSNMYKLLQLFGVSGIVLHHDVDLTHGYQESVAGTQAILRKWENVSLSRRFGELDVYTLDNGQRPQWGYIARNVYSVTSQAGGINLVMSDEDFDALHDAFIISSHQLLPSLDKQPQMSTQKLSPTNYRFDIKGATEPYLLVLSVNYHPNWVATIDDQSIGEHIRINGYANGWLIDQPGSYDVDVVFKVWPWD